MVLCQNLKVDHTNKWCTHDTEFVLENEMPKIHWDFEIKTDHLILARRSNLMIVNKIKKRTSRIVDFAIPADHRVTLKERENRDTYLDLARELKKLWNMKLTVIPIVIGALSTVTKGLVLVLKDLETTNYRLVDIGQNTKKSLGDLRRLDLTQTLTEYHQLTLV